ncbi:MAG: hypothetical protein AAGF86_15080 [Pseudomonadota bacterium]
MFKQTALGIAAAAAITVTALSGTTTTAQAGNFHFHVGVPYYGGAYYGGHGYYRNPCRHWKRKWRRTGRYYFLRRYRRCMRRHY